MAGTTTINVKVTDSVSGTTSKQLSVTINPPGVGPVTITSLSPLASGTVGTAYTVPLTSSGGTPPLAWSVVSGTLPVGLTLNPSTGQISGTPTIAGTSTFTIQVQDSETPPQSDQKPFSLTVNSFSSDGSGGTLSVANAPAIVGGTFVADGRFTGVSVIGNIAVIVWAEAFSGVASGEIVNVAFDPTTGQISSINFVRTSTQGVENFECSTFAQDSVLPQNCQGATINRAAGTFTLANVGLPFHFENSNLITVNSTLTLNGTLTFTPF